jgi:hypothetical protein
VVCGVACSVLTGTADKRVVLATSCRQLESCWAYYGTRRFSTVFTRVLHWSLSWAISIESILSQPVSLRSILILYTHLRLRLPSGLFPFGFLTNILYAFLFSPFRATCPVETCFVQ